MGDYNLQGLNPRDFEHLTQALAIKVIASGVTPFGDGKDGGREATYHGKMNYPSIADFWDGYLVIQCKFRIRPDNDPVKDGEWALTHLEADLKKFIDPVRNLPKPDYYLFVTNVILTPVQDTGSKDKATELFEQYKPLIGLKSYDIWDFDKLCRLLDGQPEICNKYSGFITSGDVLAKMMHILQTQEPDFFQVMSIFLQNELRKDQFAKLEQAGHDADQKTPLAHVFVDLPAFGQPTAEPPEKEHDRDNLPTGIVAEIIEMGSQVLKRSVFFSSEPSSAFDFKKQTSPELGRFVVVGGPGQGKSTVGQFICQLYRAAILKNCPPHAIIPEATQPLSLIFSQCESIGTALPSARRFPVRVVLDEFATDLANNEVKSLIEFILLRIKLRTNRECSEIDLRRWLAAYPWLIVLDGLDEVPATSNRIQVLEAITDFWAEVATLDADVLVVATTRPQGYNEDFSPYYYQHRYLAPLSKARALHYSTRLTEARYSTEPERKERVIKRLRAALEQETTARLMRSPLQVTIMATLVEKVGQPPQERWRLFQKYYEVIYERETERDIPASRILQQRKPDVNAIHNRVGLLLQTESEQSGGTESRLSVERFRKLVRAQIEEEGFEGEELEFRIKDITDAAINRLVFLVGLEEDRIGFEIRSLQEFTAAEALMEGGDDQVRARLVAIAPSAHWRNVFLFAAGKCFVERRYLRDMIIGICEQLNDSENDALASATLAGSRLALDIFNDGIAREYPNFARSLVRLALRLLELPDEEANMRLARIYTASLENLFREKVAQQFGQKHFVEKRGGWFLLTALAERGIEWVIQAINTNWPNEINQQYSILSPQNGDFEEAWYYEKLPKLIPHILPWQISSLICGEPFIKFYNLPSWLSATKFITGNLRKADILVIKLYAQKTKKKICKIKLLDINDPNLIPIKEMPFKESAWAVYVAGARFSECPTHENLAKELRWLSNVLKIEEPFLLNSVAWPLAACVQASSTAEDLLAFAEKAENGNLGTLADWNAAQERWQKEGLTEEDIRYLTDERWPFDSSIGKIGFPFNCVQIPWDEEHVQRLWNFLWEEFSFLTSRKIKSKMADILIALLNYACDHNYGTKHKLSFHQLHSLYLNHSISYFHSGWLDIFEIPELLNEEHIDFFNWIGEKVEDAIVMDKISFNSKQLAKAFCENPAKQGLITILGAAYTGSDMPIPLNLLQSPAPSNLIRIFLKLLQLIHPDQSKAEIINLAKEFADASSGSGLVMLAFCVLRNNKLSFAKREVFALALRKNLVEAKSEDLIKIVEPLNNLIRERPGRIGEVEYWRELGLPTLA